MDTRSSNATRTASGIHAVFGALRQAGDFASDFDEAAKLGASVPVFTSQLAKKRMKKLKGRSVFRVGGLPLEDCIVMTIRFQIGTTLSIWLADASDPDFWKAIDNVRSTGEAGFSFASGEDVWFTPYRTHDGGTTLDIYRQAVGRTPNGFVPKATALIASGALGAFTSSMLSGVEVTYAQGVILDTPHVRAAAKAFGATILQC